MYTERGRKNSLIFPLIDIWDHVADFSP